MKILSNETQNRLALIGIVVEDRESVEVVNKLLQESADYIKGRMGLPYKERNISIISIVIDAPNDVISSLSGRLGKLSGVSSKVLYSKWNG